MRGRDGGRWVVVATMAAFALAGCGGSGTPEALPTGTIAAPTAATSSSTAPSPTAVASKTVGPSGVPIPQLPAAARQNTKAGALAYSRYFVDILTYTYASRDSAPLRSVSASDCVLCRGVANGVDADSGPGWKYEGSKFTGSVVVISRWYPAAPKTTATISVTALTVTDPKGKRTTGKAYPKEYLFMPLQWTSQGWRTGDMTLGVPQ